MTASIINVKTSYVTVKTTSGPLKLSLKTKKKQLNQLRETLEVKENENPASRERQVGKDEDGIVFGQDALMDKEQRLAAERAQELCGSKKRLSRRQRFCQLR